MTNRRAVKGRNGLYKITGPDAPPPGGAQIWGSNHQYGLGSTEIVLRDGNRFTGFSGGTPDPAVGEIVTAASVGLDTPYNVFKLYFRAGGNCMIQIDNVVPESTTHWGRVWIRNDEEGNKNDHPTAYYNIHPEAEIQSVPHWRNALDLTGVWDAGCYASGGYPYNRWYRRLTNGVWYRYEWMMEFLTATTFRVWPRIYNAAGTLLYTAADYTHELGGGDTLESYWNAGNYNTHSRPDLARHFGYGNEGPSGSTNTGQPYYYANLAFSLTDWVGDTVLSYT